MRRTDRLFSIIQLLRRRRVVTAAELAERLEVSERTIYRDIRDLLLAGTPIEGEAGVGYRMRPGYDLPPLMFDRAEIEALVLGARLVESFGDEELARSARSVLDKVESVLPPGLKSALTDSRLFAVDAGQAAALSRTLLPVRQAVAEQRKLCIDYTREDGQSSQRVVRPLGAFFWGKVWTLAAWCEKRDDFRTFRVDRIDRLSVLEPFADEPGRTLRDYLRRIGPEAERLLGP